MTVRGHKLLSAAQMLLLLVPLTLATALLAALSYPAYPIPFHPLQAAFDAAVLLEALAIVAAWRLTVALLHGGPASLASAPALWTALLGTGAAIGVAAAAVAVVHALDPQSASPAVGFALLAPAAALVPIWLHLLRMRRRAGA